jgi:tripartite-type tricarboxylate transporter receptor subunit TctC
MDRRRFVAVAGILAATASSCATAQADWPRRPIRMVLPAGPGGTSDVFMRSMTDALARELGQQIVVDNRPGAGGTLAAGIVAAAEPDGSVFMMNSLATHGIGPNLYRLGFDVDRDVTAVALLAQMPNVLYVRADFPARTVGELIAWGGRNPGKLSYASAGQGTTLHLSGVKLAQASGLELLHVPYNGGAPAIQSVLRGETHFSFENVGAVIGQIKGGTVRPLAVTTLVRSEQLPDVPTMIESGLPGFDVSTWFGIVGPGRLPASIAQRFAAVLERVTATPDILERIRRIGAEPRFLGPAEFDRLMRDERAQWGRVVKAAGVQVN